MEEKTTRKIKLRYSRWLGGLLAMFVILFSSGLQAQEYKSLLRSDSIFSDTIDHLIISEWRGDTWNTSYIELCNMGDTAIDLRQMGVRSLPGGKGDWDPVTRNGNQVVWFDSLKLSVEDYTLEPGEVFLMAPHLDELQDNGDPIHRPELVEMADWLGYKAESVENDTANEEHGARIFRMWGGYPFCVFSIIRDSLDVPPFYTQRYVITDNINFDRDPITDQIGLGFVAVAGFPEATNEAVLVRKHTITKGTFEGDFLDAAGDDITNSEWIPIKHDESNPGGKVYKTAGNHGNFTMDVSGAAGVTVDLVNKILEVPWGALRGEGIIDEHVILGDGMAWNYQNYSEEGDSLLDVNDLSFNQIAMEGDVLKLFACGDNLETVELTIKYAAYAQDLVKAYATYKKNDLGEWQEYYYVTDDEPSIDTIGNVPFATRIDTLMSYIDVAPNSSWEIVFVDGEDRVDLKHGDILKITGADGSTEKQYFIDVQEYAGGSSAVLNTMKWPDIFLQGANIPFYLQNGWASGASLSDTVPDFSGSKTSYFVKLATGTTEVPALLPVPMDMNATIEVDRATDLYGTIEQRTTTIKVTSEDTLSTQTYSILFDVHQDAAQLFHADPIFSTLIFTFNTRNAALELYNPGNTELDLSRYLIVKTNTHNDPVKAIQDTSVYLERYNKYIPGYVYKTKDEIAWDAEKDYTMTKGGVNIKSTIGPGDVFVMANMHNKQNKWWPSIPHTLETDVIFHPKAALVEPYYPAQSIYTPEEIAASGEPVDQQQHVGYARGQYSFMLFKILNDEILNGTKHVYDTADFKLIDAIGDPVNSPDYVLSCIDPNGDTARTWTVLNGGGGRIFIREPDVFKGVSKPGEGISEDPDICQWIVGEEGTWPQVDGARYSGMTRHLGSHNIDPVTVYKSTITSANYIVSIGFEGDQSVKGVVDGTTVAAFTANVTKADEEQYFKFRPYAGGADLGDGSALMNNDTLIVTAADSSNATRYVLEVTASGLKDNAKLTSTAYAVSAGSGPAETITGIAYGTTLQEVLANVEKDADAMLTVIDGDGNRVGLNSVGADGTIVLTTANADIYFEVIAQDKVTKIVYQLLPTVSDKDAYVLSDVYTVSEDMLDGLTLGISVEAFFNNIIVVGGESYIEDVAGYKREIGMLNLDDKLVIVSSDGTVLTSYFLGFFGQVVNRAPVVDMPAAINATIDVSFNVAATVLDDGLPEGGSLTYSWAVISGTAGDVSIATPSAVSTDVTISAAGNYTLELTVSDGEIETKGTVDITAAVTVEQMASAKLEIYPNPTTGKVFIVGLMLDSRVSVYSATGKLLDQFNANEGRHFVELEQAPAGTYFIEVKENNGSLRIGKVIKR